MSDDDLDHMEYEPEQPAEPVDENSLGFILGKALKSIDEIGGLDRAKLADLVGRDLYTNLLNKPKVASAIDTYLTASPGTNKAAGRMLATHIARATDHPEVLDRIERELQDTYADAYAPPTAKRASARGQELQKITAQQRSGQRVADPDLVELARRDDITAYRRARMNPRGNQRAHRHGIP
jgi:hypothetical protein